VSFRRLPLRNATVLRWSIYIAAPRTAVWGRLCDFTGWPRRFPGVREVRVPGGNPAVGADRVLVLAVGPAHHERFTAWDPGRGFAVAVLDPPLFADGWEGRPTLRHEGAGTVLDWELRYRPRFGTAGRVLDRLVLAPVLGLAFRVALLRLRRLVEAA